MFELVLAPRSEFEVYNVGSGTGQSVREVLKLLQVFADIDADVFYEPPTAESRRLPSWIVLDVSKASSELGWRPEVQFEQGLQAMCRDAVAAS
jgi:nucleoside-diphosphate-sugar epimerase